jgi:hypothetical protein
MLLRRNSLWRWKGVNKGSPAQWHRGPPSCRLGGLTFQTLDNELFKGIRQMSRENKMLAVVNKEKDRNMVEEFKQAKRAPIIKELERIRANMVEAIGTEAPLFRLIDMALRSDDLKNLKVARETYYSQPFRLRRAIENGWCPVMDGGSLVLQILKLQGFEDLDDKGPGEVWVGFERVVLFDDDEDFDVPDVAVFIAEGTAKEIAIKILKESIDRISEEWEIMLRGE